MKRVLITGILAASVVVGGVYWLARKSVNVYSLHVYAGGWMSGSEWHIGKDPSWIGFSEWIEVGMPDEWGKKRDTPTYTDIDLGSHQYRVKAKAWQVGLVSAGALALISWLMIVAWDGFRDRFPPSA